MISYKSRGGFFAASRMSETVIWVQPAIVPAQAQLPPPAQPQLPPVMGMDPPKELFETAVNTDITLLDSS